MAKKKRSVVVDWGKATSGGGRLRVPEGDYMAVSRTASYGTAKSSGNSMITVQFDGKSGKLKGKEFRDYFPLTDNMLWKLRQFIEAGGGTVPSKKAKLDLRALEGLKVGVTMGDDEDDNGKPRSRPQDYIDPADVGVKKSKKKGKEKNKDEYVGLSRAKLDKLAKKRGVKVKSSMTDKQVVKALKKNDSKIEDIDLDKEL